MKIDRTMAILAIVAGVIILLFPNILSYILAIYLIVFGALSLTNKK